MATRFDVEQYVEREGREKVMSAKEEQRFSDLGLEVRVWNVVTDKGRWWVVEGDGAPMNLYPQTAYYFSSDEAYSFHMGVMARVHTSLEKDPEHALRLVRFGQDRFAGVRRKLHVAAQALPTAAEAEDHQAIGLSCREALIALGAEIVINSDVPEGEEPPKRGDFKNRAQLAIGRMLPGPQNDALRKHSRKICEAAWEWTSSLTHSPTRSRPDSVIALTMTGAVIGLFEQLLEKFAYEEEFECPSCRSRQLQNIDRQAERADPVERLLICDYCGWREITHVQDDGPS